MSERRANREREILDVAARLFCERGYSATTVDDIAAAVGFNKAMLYYYFSNKAGMLYHLYLTTVADLSARLEKVGDEGTADVALSGIVRAVVEAITAAPDYVRVFFQELQWLNKWLPTEEYETIRDKQAEFLGGVQKVIERGVAEGTFRPVDSTIAVSAVVGMAGWTYQWYGRSPKYSAEQLSETLVGLALGALMAHPGAAGGGSRKPGKRRAQG